MCYVLNGCKTQQGNKYDSSMRDEREKSRMYYSIWSCIFKIGYMTCFFQMFTSYRYLHSIMYIPLELREKFVYMSAREEQYRLCHKQW